MVTRKPLPDDAQPVQTDIPNMNDMRRELYSANLTSAGITSPQPNDPLRAQEQHLTTSSIPVHETSMEQNAAPQAEAFPDPDANLNTYPSAPPNYEYSGSHHETPQPPRGLDFESIPLSLQPGTKLSSSQKSETNPFKRKDAPSPRQNTVEPLAEDFASLHMADNTSQTQATSTHDAPPFHASVEPVSQSSAGYLKPNATPSLPSLNQEALEIRSVSELSTSPSAVGSPPENRAHDHSPTPGHSGEVPDLLPDDTFTGDKNKGKAVASLEPHPTGSSAPTDAWSIIDPLSDPNSSFTTPVPSQQPLSGPPATENGQDGSLLATSTASATPVQQDQRPRHSPRPVDSKSETYQIKNITWNDQSDGTGNRISPILLQNANGPCPLVALVNALTLTTPGDVTDTALVQMLRSREQISLGLLLNGVFDELMSPRRTRADKALPDDVGELYDFLQGLHTGMNVNPRFVPTPDVVDAWRRTSLTQLQAEERDQMIPGTFEDTVEMALYSTFSIPLIHGWLPRKDDPAHEALSRQAPSYDQAQNLLFLEEELEAKLSGASDDGLTEEEQQMYQDVISIRSFLESSATQLTSWGLDVINQAMKPGLFAILFRNDHFSTLYRHPTSGKLLVLVTDEGYANHAEVVWETLADINGLNNEFLSGDFRAVGGQDAFHSPREDQGSAWFDEPSSSANAASGAGGQGGVPSSDQDVAQEDHDLALALQLQEEEDEQHRKEEARRKRERELSEQYIEQQARQPGGRQGSASSPQARGGPAQGARGGSQNQSSLVSPRGSSQTARPTAAPASSPPRAAIPPIRSMVPPTVPPRRTNTNPEAGNDDTPPPTYEQAQSATPYVPPVGHPSHPSSSNTNQGPSPEATTGPSARPAAAAHPVRGPGYPVYGPGRNRPVPSAGTIESSRERECVVM